MKSKNLQYNTLDHGLRMPREEIAFTERPKIQSQSQIFRYGRSIFCLPHRPKISDFFDLCLQWMSVVRGVNHGQTGPAYLLTVKQHDNDNHKILFIE